MKNIKKKKRSKTRVWVMPVLSKRRTMTYTCLLKPLPRQTTTCPHCAGGSELVKLATKRKPFDPYRPATGLGRIAEIFHTCCRIVAKRRYLCIISVLSVLAWSRTNFRFVRPPKRLVTGNVRTDCLWTEVYDL